MGKNIVIAIYSHPEYYPPTLNVIEHLSTTYQKITIIHRNITGFDWKYPANVELISACKIYNIRDAEKVNVLKKVYWFFRFTLLLLFTIRKIKPDAVLLYDSMPTLSWQIIQRIIPVPNILWYHNHDIAEHNGLKKRNLSFWASKAEKWIFPQLNIFSLPALERKIYFPMNKLKGEFFFIPNYPSLQVYTRLEALTEKRTNSLCILFQGSIGPFHGLEEIITLLKKTVNNKKLILVLKGFINNEYKKELLELAKKHNVEKNLTFLPPTGYADVVKNTQACDIGIAIHKKQDIMNATLGTASNKIYEYAACGLPVLLFDNPHFREILGNRKWAFFTDCSKESLLKCIEQIDEQYTTISKAAKHDFLYELSFENYFDPVFSYLKLN